MNNNGIEVALVLGAGGSRGAVHVGVLEILQQYNIPIDLIVGSSSGAIAGALFAYYGHYSYVYDKLLSVNYYDVLDIKWYNLWRLFFTRKGLCEGNNMQKSLYHELPNCDITDLKTKLTIVATDLKHFSAVEIKSGNLINAVFASSAAPPFFTPVEIDGKQLMDGGISSPVPVDIAKKYNPKIIIAVNIAHELFNTEFKNFAKLYTYTTDTTYYRLAVLQSSFADIIIHPQLSVPSTDDSSSLSLYELGKSETLKQIPKILKLLGR